MTNQSSKFQEYKEGIVGRVMEGYYRNHPQGQELLEVDLDSIQEYYNKIISALDGEIDDLESKIDELEDELNDLEDDFEEYGDFKARQKKRMKEWLK
jgi:chromosome segregation ATPase